jgi:hypothetical protein
VSDIHGVQSKVRGETRAVVDALHIPAPRGEPGF